MFNQVPNISYSNIHGVLESIQPLDKVAISTKVGTLIPIYRVEDHGRKKLTPVKVDPLGRVKSLQLQDVTQVSTTVGEIPTEFITFYPSGNIRRVFPLNGKLSGYWSEDNEYNLAKIISIKTMVGTISVKPIYVHFYETGELKSITFWPKERVLINTRYGEIKIKTGISFYKSGRVKSFEPDSQLSIETPIGNLLAYDPDPIGINGEKNSLSFNEEGDVITISTISSEVIVVDNKGMENIFTPDVQPSRCDDEIFILMPLKIEFHGDEVIFKYGFKTIGKSKKNSEFIIKEFTSDKVQNCNLSSCSKSS